jgi:hypothetical protein
MEGVHSEAKDYAGFAGELAGMLESLPFRFESLNLIIRLW